MIRIFDLIEGRVKLNENCLLIPELKAIVDKFTDPIPALSYINFMTSPESPYGNIPEEEKQQVISDDVGGEFEYEDEVITKALDKMSTLFNTPSMRYFKSLKLSMDHMSEFLANNKITSGKDGNAEVIDRLQSNAAKKMESFKKMEKIVDDEIKVAMRGKAQSGMY